jgi:hypothetical protein
VSAVGLAGGISLALAAYGAILSTALGYLTWRKERHRLHFSTRFVRGHDTARLEITVINTGFRPLHLQAAYFELDDGGGYLPTSDEELGLPCKLAEGDSLPMHFDAADLWPGTSTFIVRDHNREHRKEFSRDFRQEWEG